MNHSRNSVRKLTMLALLTAMSIVFARVLSISTGFVRFTLGSLPTLLAAVLFGPVEGFAVGDARIATHIYEDDCISNVYSIIHEAGHATVSWILEHASPLIKVLANKFILFYSAK